LKSALRPVGLAAIACIVGCAYNPLFPDPRTASSRAHDLDERCARSSEAGDAPALSAAVIEDVAPSYASVQSGNDRVVRMRGARLRFLPQAAFSAESIRRSLECHQARVVTGRAPALPNDPYTLPDTWLDLDVTSAGDGFVVAITTDDFAKAREVLERARRFAHPSP
jgi:hypothetical protein